MRLDRRWPLVGRNALGLWLGPIGVMRVDGHTYVFAQWGASVWRVFLTVSGRRWYRRIREVTA